MSTSSDRELTEFNTPLLQFSRHMPDVPEFELLRHEHRWYLGSKDGCSCGFRHLDRGNQELGFSEPAEWWPEEPEDIEATRQVLAAFKVLLAQGAKLDCIDAWACDEKSAPRLHGEMGVDLDVVPEVNFRFFEGHRFELIRSGVHG